MGSKSAMPAARLGDIDTGHPPSPPTPIIIGSSNVLINSRPAARKGDMLVPHHPGIRKISEGSSSVLINGKPAARMLDGVNCGGKIIIGSGNVFIGDNPKTGGGGGVTSNIKVDQEFDEYIDSKFNPENQKLTDYQWRQLEADLAVKYRGNVGAVATWAEYYQEAIPEGPPQSAAEAEGLKIAKALNSASELDETEAAVYSEEVQAQVDKAGQALAQAAAQLPEGEMITPEMVHVAEQALAATGYVEQPHSHNHQASKVSELDSVREASLTFSEDVKIDLQHIKGEVNPRKWIPKLKMKMPSGTGGHYLNKNIRVLSEIKPRNSVGVYEARVEVFDSINKVWVPKLNAKGKLGKSTMFSDDWSEERIITEIQEAYIDAGIPTSGKWVGVSSSGVKIEGYVDESENPYDIRSAWPIYEDSE